MMLAAGAAVPFVSTEQYTYTYNILEFDWDEHRDALTVKIYPRVWNAQRTRFESDDTRLNGEDPKFTLARETEKTESSLEETITQSSHTEEDTKPTVELVSVEAVKPQASPTIDGYELTMLRFFRDLVESERLLILLDLEAFPPDCDERLTQSLERKLFDWLARRGKIPEVIEHIDRIIAERGKRK